MPFSFKTIKRALKGVQEGDVVQVMWGDAFSHDGWTGPDNVPDDPMKCITVGHFVALHKKGLVVAASSNGHQVASAWLIPTGWITKLRVLS